MRYAELLFKANAAEEHDPEAFDNVTEEEIISLWRSFKTTGLSEDAAWHAIVTGIALDMVFSRSRSLSRAEH